MPTILGPIVRLQVQRTPLKVGAKPNRVYVTEPIVQAPRLALAAEGAVALVPHGEIVDVHNARHPATHNADGRHGVSVGFTAHYRAMRERYGDHMTVGCAGENVIVESERAVAPEEAAAGFVVLAADDTERCRLVDVRPAPPCREFIGFAHGGHAVDQATWRATRDFLDGGMRGFYCTMAAGAGGQSHVMIAAGDRLALLA